MHAKMAYLNGVAETRVNRRRMNEDMARRDRSVGGRHKEEAVRVWARQANRRLRKEERQEVLDRLTEHFAEEMDWTCTDMDCSCNTVVPTYRYEAGYRDDDENCLEFWQDTCNCEACGRYLPVGGTAILYSPMAEELVSSVRMPIAHVNHDGKVCHGGQDRATSCYLVFDVYDIQGEGLAPLDAGDLPDDWQTS